MPYHLSTRTPLVVESKRLKIEPFASYWLVGKIPATLLRLFKPLGQRKTESPKDDSPMLLIDGPCGGEGRCLVFTRIVDQSSRSAVSPGCWWLPGTRNPLFAPAYMTIACPIWRRFERQ